MEPKELQQEMLPQLDTELRQMLGGKRPDFGKFMGRYGEFFPKKPKSLDDLLET